VMEGEKKQPKSTNRAAIIGLVGTILTVCAGLSGALVGGLTTIYKVEHEAQQIAIAAPQSDRPLTVDTRQISISSSEATKLDTTKFQVFQDLGFVLAQPKTGWQDGGQMTYQDLFLEQGTDLSPLILFSTWIKNSWDDQPVRQVSFTKPVMVQFLEGSTENGVLVDPANLENDTIGFYSRIITLVLSKAVTGEDFSLSGLALAWGGLHQGGVNTLIANPDSRYVFEQVSWLLKGVNVDGQKTNLALQRWALFAESSDQFYIVEMQYVPTTNQSKQVWDDLQEYLIAFRIIQ
jgi:ribonuclease HI